MVGKHTRRRMKVVVGPSVIVTVLLLPKACIVYTDSVSKEISLPIQIHSTYQQRLRNSF